MWDKDAVPVPGVVESDGFLAWGEARGPSQTAPCENCQAERLLLEKVETGETEKGKILLANLQRTNVVAGSQFSFFEVSLTRWPQQRNSKW